jgi:class 3 adenylate cyclase
MEKLVLWFIPKSYLENEDQLRKARYFIKACLFTAGFSFFYFWVSAYFEMPMPMYAMVHDTLLIGLLPFLFKNGLKINYAGNLFILFGTIGVTWTVFYTGGFESGTLVWYAVLPIASLLLVNKMSSYIWSSICIAVVIFIGVLQIQGYAFENQIDPAYVHHFNISTISGIVFMLFLIALVFENTKQDAFNQLEKNNIQLAKEKKRSDNLLLNILPLEVAEELKETGESQARDFDNVTVLFTDFKEFTETAEKMSAKELVHEINSCFKAFDEILDKYNVEKIKTIGDSYMAAGGLTTPRLSEPHDTTLAALEMQKFMIKRKQENSALGKAAFDMRVGIHTGPVVAGIVGVKKFQYDLWGDTVNTASRMETNGEIGKINISQTTYDLLKNQSEFSFESRGKIEAKGKGKMYMYFVSLSER